jgi:hypothetical protein
VVLVDFLRANTDIFAWSPSDMPGIPREVAEHSLDILPHSCAVQQRLRRFDEERRQAIKVELRKLLEVGFIKEVFHSTWLANPILVKKKIGKWRMCVDYTSLNKTCPKVPFPLPRIHQIVDSTAGCELLCFLDAYSGYHQIKMKESDQLATSFTTPFGMYCYVTMSFSLRNAGTTYQRCMQHVFGVHIERTVEAYIDDIVVKTRKADDVVNDLRMAFDCLRANGVKLNPRKVRLRSAVRHAVEIHRLPAGNRAQPQEGHSTRADGPDLRPQGGPEGAGVPRRLEPLYFAARREEAAPLPTLEEARALLLDCRGPGGA